MPPIQSGSILNDRYVIEAPIGEGGMATVYRAQDLETKEHVAVKVMRQELAHAIGAQRFAREIAIASRLDHPRIVSLIDSGSDGDNVYSVMPLFAGETLRDRLDRETQLPVEDGLAIAQAVADALDFAHGQTPPIVHRDVKPENILVSGDRVGLADFGIAKALDDADPGGHIRTSTGIAVGTALYMSPEQATAGQVDGRTDVYGLACVLYEMLAGEPPFTGPNMTAIIARHVTDPVPDLRTVRPGLPDPIWFAIKRAMAKTPADRFKSAGEFMEATRSEAVPEPPPSGREKPEPTPRPWRKVVAGLVGVAAVAAAAIVLRDKLIPPPPPPLADSLVAVLPFSLQAPDESDRWLATAFPINIAELLDGTGGLRAASWTRTELALDAIGRAWEDDLNAAEARQVAQGLGAGLYVAGSILSDGTQRIATITLIDTETGDEVNRAREEITELGVGSAVDRALAALFVDMIDQARQSESLFGQSQEALRAYVDGWLARRDQRHEDAARDFIRAVQLDSTFALAALSWDEAQVWLPDEHELRTNDITRGMWAVVAAHLDRLPSIDREIAETRLATSQTRRDVLAERQRLARLAPDRASLQLQLGDYLYHEGYMIALPDFREQAAAAFESALALGDFTPEAQRHLDEIRFERGDSAYIRAYLEKPDRPGETFDPLHWAAAWMLGDSAMIERYGEAIDTLPGSAHQRMLRFAKYFNVGFPDADRAADVLAAQPDVPGIPRLQVYGDLLFYQIDRGRPDLAEQLAEERYEGDRARVANSLLLTSVPVATGWSIDDDIVRLAQQTVTRLYRPGADRPDRGNLRVRGHCTLGINDALQGRFASAEGHRDNLRSGPDGWATDVPPDPNAEAVSPRWQRYSEVCAALVSAALPDSIDDSVSLEDVADLLDPSPSILRVYVTSMSLYLALLFERDGRPDRALDFVDRRGHFAEEGFFLTPSYLMEARLSLQVGDTARAITALDRAVALLSDPEPSMEPVAEEARATLSELVAR